MLKMPRGSMVPEIPARETRSKTVEARCSHIIMLGRVRRARGDGYTVNLSPAVELSSCRGSVEPLSRPLSRCCQGLACRACRVAVE